MSDSKTTIELFLAINEDGGWIVCKDESDALNDLAEQEGGYAARVVKLNVSVSLPTITETDVDVADEAHEETTAVAA